MAVFKYRDFSGGIAPDIFVHKQQANQCSRAHNYRFWKNAMTKINGQRVQLTTMPLIKPTLIDFWRLHFTTDVGYYITAKAGQVFKTDENGTNTDVTQSGFPYTNSITGLALDDDSIWTSTQMFGGLTFILSNADVTPQFLTNNPTISPLGKFQSIPGWVWNIAGDPDPYVAVTAKVIRSFDNQLWAGNITKKRASGAIEYYPNLILYSDKATNPANTYQNYIPDTWEPSIGTATVASNWAGFASLNTNDPIVEMLPLRDVLLVFTANSTYAVPKLSYPQEPLTPQILSSTRGLLSNDCSVAIDGVVYMVTTDDIVATTGASVDFESIANKRVKDTFFRDYLTQDPAWQLNTFVRYNRFFNELWIFYASRASTDGSCDQVLIYNIEHGTFTTTDAPGIYSSVYGPVIGQSGDPWTGYNFSYSRLNYQVNSTLLAQDQGYIRRWGSSTQISTEWIKVFDMEEQGSSNMSVKTINQILPYISGSIDATIDLVFSNIPFVVMPDFTTPDYSGGFTTLEDYKIDAMRNGRFVAVRVTTVDSRAHGINTINFDIEIAGARG